MFEVNERLILYYINMIIIMWILGYKVDNHEYSVWLVAEFYLHMLTWTNQHIPGIKAQTVFSMARYLMVSQTSLAWMPYEWLKIKFDFKDEFSYKNTNNQLKSVNFHSRSYG